MPPFASLVTAGVADTAAAKLAGSPRGGRAAAAGHLAGPPRSGRVAGAVAMVAVVAVALLALPHWYQGDRDLMTVDHDKPFRQAEAWINGHVPHRGRLLVDDSLWVDLVQDGYPPGQVVWFYKLDTDRDVRARHPRGWRDFDRLPPRRPTPSRNGLRYIASAHRRAHSFSGSSAAARSRPISVSS